MNEYPKDFKNYFLRNAKRRALKKNLTFNISLEDLIFPEYCPLLNIKLNIGTYYANSNSYSIDRIDPSKGYIKGNVQIISHRANTLKGNATLEELKKLAEWMEKNKNES